MSDTTTQIIGIAVNAIMDLAAIVVAFLIGRKQIQLMLQPAQPAPKPKTKKRPRLTRIQRRFIVLFRLIQYLCVSSFITNGYPDYLAWSYVQPSKLKTLYIAIAVLGYIGNVVLFFQLQWYIGRIKARDRKVLIYLGALKPREPKQNPEPSQP